MRDICDLGVHNTTKRKKIDIVKELSPHVIFIVNFLWKIIENKIVLDMDTRELK